MKGLGRKNIRLVYISICKYTTLSYPILSCALFASGQHTCLVKISGSWVVGEVVQHAPLSMEVFRTLNTTHTVEYRSSFY
jgi:hypothetical protein